MLIFFGDWHHSYKMPDNCYQSEDLCLETYQLTEEGLESTCCYNYSSSPINKNTGCLCLATPSKNVLVAL